MDEQLPSVSQAITDGDGPIKQTRRPALSCVECRLRKVKCDRGKPCGACIRIKSEKCTYRPTRTRFQRKADDLPAKAVNNTRQSVPEPRISTVHQRPELNTVPESVIRSVSFTDTQASSLVAILLKENQHLRTAFTHDAAPIDGTQPIVDIVTDIPGTFQKSKFFGQSHWMNALEPYEALGDANVIVNPATDRVEVNKSTELYKTVNELKTMARVLKKARMLQPTISPEALDSLPPKETCDILVDAYFRTFEGVFRVLHVPSFRKEYGDHWLGKASGRLSVLLKIMLVCAIGVPFYTGTDQPRLRVSCAKWIQAAENWLAAPHTKSRLNMAGLQIQILVLLAKQVCSVEGDHVWIPAGSLLRTAMYLGLHRDPSFFGKINTFHAEMRRRLWATVLELTLQSSMDTGMSPMISIQEYDTKPPSNINDDDLHEQDNSPLNVKPLSVCTDCSLQIAMTESLPMRLDITRLINSLRFDLSYPKCLQIGSQLTEVCNAKTRFFREALNHGAGITPFQIKLSDSLVRRYILGLHRPYFAKAKEEPQFHFSRKVCLESSLTIFAPATAPMPGVVDDWTLMTYRAVGFFKSLVLYALSTIFYELNTQIDEHRASANLTAPLTSTASERQPFALPPQMQPLYDTLASAYNITMLRMRNGETNAKGVVFLACAIARIDALVAGTDSDAMVLAAAKANIAEVRKIMADVYEQEHGEPIDLGASRAGEKEHGRGDGADDVTGQGVPTGTSADADLGISSGVEESAGVVDGFDLDVGAGSESFSPDDMMDFNSHFLSEPEWFFDTNAWTGMGIDTILSGF